MRKIDFNKPIVNLDNVAIETKEGILTVKEIVTNSLCISKPKTAEEAQKQLNLARTIYNSSVPIDIDDSTFELIKKSISQADLSALVLGQIIEYLDSIKPIEPRRR